MKFTFLNAALTSLILTMSNITYAGLIEIAPLGYTFDKPTGTGTFSYHDETGNQLIDGEYGSNNWADNLGSGNAYEWVGWVNYPSVNIDFTLDSNAVISLMSVGSVQDNLADVVLPSLLIYSRNLITDNWTLITQELVPESNTNNGSHYTYDFSGLNISDQFIRVQANHSLNGPWTFIDEVDFYQETVNVPEPSTFAIFALSIIALASRRFNK